MTDIMQEFKDRKFVVTPSYISKGLPEPVYGHLVVMTDFTFWHDNFDALLAWANDNNCEVKGMTIDIPNDETLTLFCLRWR